MVARHHNILFTLVLLPVFLVAVFSFLQIRKQMATAISEERRTLATLSAHLLNEKLDHVADIGLSLSERPVMRQLIGEKKWHAAMSTLKDVTKDFPFVSRISIYDSAGVMKGGLPATQPLAGVAHFPATTTGFTGLYAEEEGKDKFLFALIMPLSDTSGKAAGRLIMEINAHLFFDWTKKLGGGTAGTLFIADPHGIIAAGPPEFTRTGLGGYISTAFIGSLLKRETTTDAVYNPADKKYYYYTAEKIPQYGWALLIQQQPATFLSFIRKMWFVLTFYALMLLLTILFAVKVMHEVSLRKETEASLDTAEENAQLLLKNVKDYAIFMLDADGRIATWNSGAKAIKGYTAGEAIGQSIDMFYTAEDIANNIPSKNLSYALKMGHYECEGWRLRKDGSQFWANVVFTALWNKHGQLRGYAKVTKDITLQKKAAERLGFLSMQIDQSNDAIFVVDESKKILTWNKGAEKLYGFTKEEATGRDPNELLDTAFSREELRAAVEILDRNGYWAGEIQRKTKWGADIFVRSSSTTIRNKEGIITGYVGVSFDITGEKKMREEINHLAGIVEQSSEAIISMGLDLRIISWNRGAENLFGYSKEEALQKTGLELGISHLGEYELMQMDEAVKASGTWKTVKEYVHKNGDAFFGAVTANAMTGEKGETRSVIFIIKDITLHKKLELQLKHANEILEERVRERTGEISKNEKRFRALIENSAEGIVLTSQDSTVIYRSPSAAKITGKLPGDGVISPLHPDDQAYFDEKRAEAHSLPGIPVEFLARFLHTQGHYFWLEGTMTNMLHIGGVNAMVANYRDVSMRKYAEEKIRDLNQELALSERKFRGLIENGQDLIGLLDANNEVIYRSPAHWRVSGWQPEEFLQEFGKKTPFTLMHPEDRERVRAIASDCLSKPGIPLQLSYRFMHRDGHYLWMEGTIINLLHDESIRCVVTNLHDITELKKAEQHITELNVGLEQRISERTAQLQAVNRELEAFSYSVSHDLRAPLRAIVGFTTILEEDYAANLDPEAKRIADVIKKNTLKMGNLIDDLLAFSRLGRQEINKTSIDTSKMVEQVVAELDKGDKKTIQWVVPRLPRCYGDFTTLRQVWINYISNAIKYSGTMTAPRIEIGYCTEKNDQVFFVKDNGVGFNKEYKNKLFRVFQRLHASSEFDGTGVGLAIAEKIITRHHGKVWAEGETGKGACFYFSLPGNEYQF